MATERLHKILAAAGLASRRKAEAMIAEGRVSLNGEVVREPGVQADAAHDQIRVDGKRIEPATRGDHVYLLLHKPAGVVSTTDDERGRTTVLDLVPRFRTRRLVLAGRLDYHSEGLVLLTDDGELVHHLTHPRHHAPRTYHAKVRGVPDEKRLDRLRRGIHLEDGKTRPAHVQVLRLTRSNTWVEITLSEGRNHQVRRMFEAIGHPVQRLVRVMLGNLSIEGLPPGAARELSPVELRALRELVEVPGQRKRQERPGAHDRERAAARSPRARATPGLAPRPGSARPPASGSPARRPASSRPRPESPRPPASSAAKPRPAAPQKAAPKARSPRPHARPGAAAPSRGGRTPRGPRR